jgi:hypothetical protein
MAETEAKAAVKELLEMVFSVRAVASSYVNVKITLLFTQF